jgi:hypothetical protein
MVIDLVPSGVYSGHLEEYMKPQTILKTTTLLAAAGSLAMSVFLYFKGTSVDHQMDGLYVGIWVPSILSLGAFLIAGQEKA